MPRKERESGGDEPDVSPEYPKRRRIALACTVCRSRKSRCDGVRPTCGACSALGFACTYNALPSSTNVIIGKEYLGEIEDRLAKVEQCLSSMKQSQNFIIDQRRDGQPPQVLQSTSNQQAEPIDIQDGSHVSQMGEGPSDGMGAIAFTDEQNSAFFGPSSNITFTRRLGKALERAFDKTQPWSTPGTMDSTQMEGGIVSVARPSSPIETVNHSFPNRADLFNLGPHEEVLRLINIYFSDTGMLFPFLHQKTVLDKYTEFHNNNFTRVHRSWLGLLNMILAFATSVYIEGKDSATERLYRSDLYYQKALALCSGMMTRGTSLEMVQLLLLMSQYLQGTQRSVQTWSIHGLAVKAAFQLGLHSARASKSLSPLEQEIRRRTWYACVILDRTLGMTFGRPATIPEEYVKIDLPRNDPGIMSEDMNPMHEISISLYNYTITLYRIMHQVITTCYGSNLDCETPVTVFESLTQVLQLDQQLVQWAHTLPPHLQLRKAQDISDDVDNHFGEKARVILTLRYQNLRLLLHRPILLRFLGFIGRTDEESPDRVALQQVGMNDLSICVEAAAEIIGIVHRSVTPDPRRRKLLGAWWFSLYYTFNAALVVFSCWLISMKYDQPRITESISADLCSLTFHNAIEALQVLDRGNAIAEKCVEYLKQLRYIMSTFGASGPTGQMIDMPFPQYMVSGIPEDQQHNATGMEGYPIMSPFNLDLGQFMLEDDPQALMRVIEGLR
ncbi:hypothetical protein Plec18167_002289 [Paecilomyces lecythidis]|uniref:Zn(2)-C6 fungal-type domain-containing protein n=1 Tax=Paecilomyces lecythidis TaxID=3004212 RepID=A0ABR3YA70_9EURO